MTRCYLAVPAPLLLFLLFVLSTGPTTAEVVTSLWGCDQFLLDRTPPRIPGILEDGNILDQNRYKTICQTYKNKRRFVTLYDTKNKIPVFSANKYRGVWEKKRPPSRWKIEPQLENVENGENMLDDKGRSSSHQAGNVDYRNNGRFDRGHLVPSSYGFNRTDKMSTFTLTNVVPQAASLNQGSWNRMETCIKCVMDQHCVSNNNLTEGFVVTGARPSVNHTLNNKVNVPTLLWSAFCCYSSARNQWLAGAHWSSNVPDEARSKHLQTKTLAQLGRQLTLEVFPGTRCPLHRSLTSFYPQDKTCSCPPSGSTASPADPPVATASISKPSPHSSTSGRPQTTATTTSHLLSIKASVAPTDGPPAPTSGPPAVPLSHHATLPSAHLSYLHHRNTATSEPTSSTCVSISNLTSDVH